MKAAHILIRHNIENNPHDDETQQVTKTSSNKCSKMFSPSFFSSWYFFGLSTSDSFAILDYLSPVVLFLSEDASVTMTTSMEQYISCTNRGVLTVDITWLPLCQLRMNAKELRTALPCGFLVTGFSLS
jgi:hypothetical protein